MTTKPLTSYDIPAGLHVSYICTIISYPFYYLIFNYKESTFHNFFTANVATLTLN